MPASPHQQRARLPRHISCIPLNGQGSHPQTIGVTECHITRGYVWGEFDNTSRISCLFVRADVGELGGWVCRYTWAACAVLGTAGSQIWSYKLLKGLAKHRKTQAKRL